MRNLVLAILMASACGGDDRPEPVRSCERLATAWCSRAGACFPWTPAQRAECQQLALERFGCERAIATTQPALDTCLSKLPTWSCDEVRNARMPPDCTGVIRLSGGGAAP